MPESKPRPLLVSIYDTFGAGIAAYRLYDGLQGNGLNPQFMAYNTTKASTISFPDKLSFPERWWLKRVMKKNTIRLHQAQAKGATFWSDNRPFHTIAFHINRMPVDIIHLHWIGLGFVPIAALRQISKPLVWTLHDSWAFTGGCHVPLDCEQWLEDCGACPQLQSTDKNDWSAQIYRAKAQTWSNLKITIVTPSRWLAERAKRSPLLKNHPIHVIPNGIDTNTYKMLSQQEARQTLGLEPNKKYILSGALNLAGDYNKGFDLLIEAIQILAQQNEDNPPELLVLGSEEPTNKPDIGIPVTYLGTINGDDKLNQVYAAADVFVLPSRQENLPNMIMEALASGTPCAAFHIGGNSDLITHEHNGYLAKAYDTDELAKGIDWILKQEPKRMRASARQSIVDNFSIEHIATQYTYLYSEILNPKANLL